MIEDLIIGPGQVVPLADDCKSLLHAGPTFRCSGTSYLLLRIGGVPRSGAPLHVGQAVYWPKPKRDVSIQNASPYYEACLLWSQDADVTRRLSPHGGADIYVGHGLGIVAGVDKLLAETWLCPEYRTLKMGGVVDSIRPKDLVPVVVPALAWRRSTVAVFNNLGDALTLKLFGGVCTNLDDHEIVSAVIADGDGDLLSADVSAWPRLGLYTSNAAGMGTVDIVWRLHAD